jgi:hypothetical protein
MNDTELLIGARLRLNKPHIFTCWSRGVVAAGEVVAGRVLQLAPGTLGSVRERSADRVNARDPR